MKQSNRIKRYCIANWKMNLTTEQASVVAKDIAPLLVADSSVELVVCPSFTAIAQLQTIFDKTVVELGAQNMHWLPHGSVTGEISAEQLLEYGVSYVILGHSERRQLLHETDEMIHKKIATACAHRLIPIVCVGETAEQRTDGHAEIVVAQQITAALEGVHIPEHQTVCIAYEPIWAIGAGAAVGPEVVSHMAQVIRHTVADLKSNVKQLIVLYGGSVNQENIVSVMVPEINGVLVGGASLQSGQIYGMVEQLLNLDV